jgi:hypothetical protein
MSAFLRSIPFVYAPVYCSLACRPNSAPSSQNGQDTRTDEERESEAMLLREAERAKHGTFLFGCESKLSQGKVVAQ